LTILNIHNLLVPTSLSKEEAKKAFESITKEDIIEIRLFEARLWQKYLQKRRTGDITRCYANPINRTMFIGMEGTKFRFLPKDIPLPKGWRVIIRNIWNEKHAYEYPKGQVWLLESDDYDNLEQPLIIDSLAWCLGHNYDLMQLEVDVYRIMEDKGELAKGTTANLEKFVKTKK
jgi:hypothetical protein